MNPKGFFGELKRRNVYKVAVAYAVVGWLLVQVATQVYDDAGNVIETHEHAGDFKEWQATLCRITSKQLFRPARFRSIGRALDFSIELCRAYCSCPTSDTLRLRI